MHRDIITDADIDRFFVRQYFLNNISFETRVMLNGINYYYINTFVHLLKELFKLTMFYVNKYYRPDDNNYYYLNLEGSINYSFIHNGNYVLKVEHIDNNLIVPTFNIMKILTSNLDEEYSKSELSDEIYHKFICIVYLIRTAYYINNEEMQIFLNNITSISKKCIVIKSKEYFLESFQIYLNNINIFLSTYGISLSIHIKSTPDNTINIHSINQKINEFNMTEPDLNNLDYIYVYNPINLTDLYNYYAESDKYTDNIII